jgi:hypothetical protein
LILVNRIDSAVIILSLLGQKVDVSEMKNELLSDRFNFGHVLKHSDQGELYKLRKANYETGQNK